MKQAILVLEILQSVECWITGKMCAMKVDGGWRNEENERHKVGEYTVRAQTFWYVIWYVKLTIWYIKWYIILLKWYIISWKWYIILQIDMSFCQMIYHFNMSKNLFFIYQRIYHMLYHFTGLIYHMTYHFCEHNDIS